MESEVVRLTPEPDPNVIRKDGAIFATQHVAAVRTGVGTVKGGSRSPPCSGCAGAAVIFVTGSVDPRPSSQSGSRLVGGLTKDAAHAEAISLQGGENGRNGTCPRRQLRVVARIPGSTRRRLRDDQDHRQSETMSSTRSGRSLEYERTGATDEAASRYRLGVRAIGSLPFADDDQTVIVTVYGSPGDRATSSVDAMYIPPESKDPSTR